jgi:hypothetical protein
MRARSLRDSTRIWRQTGRYSCFSEVPLLSVKHRSRHDQPIAAALLLLASLTSAACDDRDATSMLPRAGSGGVGAGGAAGGAGGTSGTGTDGGATALDAGTDASGDASSPASACIVGTLEAYCNRRECPALADAREALRDTGAPYIRTIIQRPCAAPNGGARVAVTAQFLQWSLTYIYDAATEQLVGVEYIDDVAGCMVIDPNEAVFGQFTGFYGEAAPDCSPGGLDFFIPDGCADAGVIDNPPLGLDAGAPYECVLTP